LHKTIGIKRLNAFDIWCLRKILRIPYTRHTTNETVRSIATCSPVSGWVKSLRLSFFGYLARTAPEEDHHRVIAAALRLPVEWRRPVGRPRPGWGQSVWPSGHELLGPHGLEEGRQEIETFGIKSLVRQRSTLEFWCILCVIIC